jgi:hypothetical protein
MNRTLIYGAKLFAHLDPSKGVGSFRQQDGGHGSRNPLRSVYQLLHTIAPLKKELIRLNKFDNIIELQGPLDISCFTKSNNSLC